MRRNWQGHARVAIATVTIYWACVAAGAMALLLSMVVTLWGPLRPAAGVSLEARRTWCVGQIALLHAQLEHETRAALSIDDVSARWERRRDRWVRQFAHHTEAVRPQCATFSEVGAAFTQLADLAQHYDDAVMAWFGAHRTLAPDLNSAIRGLANPWGPKNPALASQ